MIVTATNAKNRFGEVLEAARSEAVHVQKNGRDVAVVISPEEYRRLQANGTPAKVRPAIEALLSRSIERRKELYEALAK